MKKLKYWGVVCLTLLMSASFSACDDDDDSDSSPVSVSKIYLEDCSSTVPDREVTFARLGQLIRIEGSGFCGLKHVYINGYDTYFNVAYVTDNSMLININQATPVGNDCDASVKNTIRFVKDGTEFIYKDCLIRSALPVISKISNTLPTPGQNIVITGTNLQNTTEIVFPGDIKVTDGIYSSLKGDTVIVAVPETLSTDPAEMGGALFLTGENGSCYSRSFFNCRAGIIFNFDGIGALGGGNTGGGMKWSDSLATYDDPLNQNAKCWLLTPDVLHTAGAFKAGKDRAGEVYTAGGPKGVWANEFENFARFVTAGLFTESEPASDFAVQFDLYIEGAQANSGFIVLVLENAYSTITNRPLSFRFDLTTDVTTPGWTTVTCPMSDFFNTKSELISGLTDPYTFATLLEDRTAASYANCGWIYSNANLSDDQQAIGDLNTGCHIYVDNMRFVKYTSPSYSEFAE